MQAAGLEVLLQTTECHEESKVAQRGQLALTPEPWLKEAETATAASVQPLNPVEIHACQKVRRAAPRKHESHLTATHERRGKARLQI